MLTFASRALVALSVLGLVAGVYQVTDGTALIGAYVLASSLGLAVTGVVLEGLGRVVGALESIKRELRQMRRQ